MTEISEVTVSHKTPPCSNNTSKHNLIIVINNHYMSTLNRTRGISCKCCQLDNLLDNILGISLKIQDWHLSAAIENRQYPLILFLRLFFFFWFTS